jgi:hypothetical protein
LIDTAISTMIAPMSHNLLFTFWMCVIMIGVPSAFRTLFRHEMRDTAKVWLFFIGVAVAIAVGVT